MNEITIRKPQQKRSIEKKNKIILAGLDIFIRNGYYKTNTTEIAKSAGVSTGTVYSYFTDKKDIYIAAFEYYLNTIAIPVIDKIAGIPVNTDLKSVVERMIDTYLALYNDTSNAMLELTTTMSIDEEINRYFCDFESQFFLKFAEAFQKHIGTSSCSLERIYLVYTLLDLLGLEKTKYKHSHIDVGILKKEVANTIIRALTAE